MGCFKDEACRRRRILKVNMGKSNLVFERYGQSQGYMGLDGGRLDSFHTGDGSGKVGE